MIGIAERERGIAVFLLLRGWTSVLNVLNCKIDRWFIFLSRHGWTVNRIRGGMWRIQLGCSMLKLIFPRATRTCFTNYFKRICWNPGTDRISYKFLSGCPRINFALRREIRAINFNLEDRTARKGNNCEQHRLKNNNLRDNPISLIIRA